MKKVIGILSVAVFAIAMFMNTSVINNSDISLANLVSLNSAEAESDIDCFDHCNSSYPNHYELFLACMDGCGYGSQGF